MLIFKSTDPNVDVTYTLWRFDVQGWLDQYQEESMMPHIYASLSGYLGRWVHSLEDGSNLTVTELLEHMDHAFGDVHEYDMMICSLYEIRQKEGESMEEYMLQIHEAVAVICHAYPDWVMDQGKNLAWDQFYHGLAPSLQDALGFTMVELPEREQASASFVHADQEDGGTPAFMFAQGGRVLLIPTGIGSGDILLPQDELQC